MRPVDPKSYAAHDRAVLERSIEGKHAVTEVPDLAGSEGDVEDGYAQMQHVETHRYGDLVVAPDDHIDMFSIMELIKGIQSKG